MVEFNIVFKKEKFEVSFPLDHTISKLKTHVEKLTGNKTLFFR